jgi:hypothetical protein
MFNGPQAPGAASGRLAARPALSSPVATLVWARAAFAASAR